MNNETIKILLKKKIKPKVKGCFEFFTIAF